MKTRKIAMLLLLLCSLLPACNPSFRKTYKTYQQRDLPAARLGFAQFLNHPKYAGAARYFLSKIDLSDSHNLPELLALDQDLEIADSLFKNLSTRNASKLSRRYELDSAAIYELRELTQRRAIIWARVRGSLPALDSLLEGLPEPLPALDPELESTRTDIVNAHVGATDYDTMTAILRRHIRFVLPENYEQTRHMQDEIWTAFSKKYPPCSIDKFAEDHPNSFAGRDCWLEELRPLLCEGSLLHLLDFHQKNRWTALEIVLLNLIEDKAAGPDSAALDAAHLAHLNDLRERTALRQKILGAPDTLEVKEKAVAYIEKYAPRYSAFRLMDECLEFFINGQHYASAIDLLERSRPFFSDTLPPDCHSNFSYQRRVKPWIDGKLPILRRPDREVLRRPLQTLNTQAGLESDPVVSADGREIYFAASGRPENIAGTDVFRARWDTLTNDWPAPELVPVLSGPGEQLPLSLTADGRQLLLYWDKQLYLSKRNNREAAWGAPEIFPVQGIPVVGKGRLSADGNILVLEGAYSSGSALHPPDLDIFVSLRDTLTGAWRRPAALGASINSDGQEMEPFLSPDNRTLYYLSTEYPGLGGSDVFSSYRTKDEWTFWKYPFNLGKEINDTKPHSGFSTVSPDGRRFWLGIDGDLWELELQE